MPVSDDIQIFITKRPLSRRHAGRCLARACRCRSRCLPDGASAAIATRQDRTYQANWAATAGQKTPTSHRRTSWEPPAKAPGGPFPRWPFYSSRNPSRPLAPLSKLGKLPPGTSIRHHLDWFEDRRQRRAAPWPSFGGLSQSPPRVQGVPDRKGDLRPRRTRCHRSPPWVRPSRGSSPVRWPKRHARRSRIDGAGNASPGDKPLEHLGVATSTCRSR